MALIGHAGLVVHGLIGRAGLVVHGLVGHEEDRVPVVLQTGVRAGQVGLRQINQFVFVFAGDRLATRTVQMCLHVAFPVVAFLAAFICFLNDRTFSSDPASTMSATDMCVPALP